MRKSILGALAALALLASPALVTPAFAVDKSISAFCGPDYAGTGYQRPGGFCDAVANNKTMLPWSSQTCDEDDLECISALENE